jgi:hypothetical protein
MKIIITESQYKKILFESRLKSLENKVDELKDFFKKVSSESKKQIGLDLSFLTTWGVTIAGFVSPVQQYISGSFPELSSSDLALLSTGIILTYYESNKEMLGKVLEKIKEKELIFEFDKTLEVSAKLKDVFFNFINSLAIPVSKISNMLAYTFLIPLIPDLYEVAQGNKSLDIKETILRIVSFVGVSFSGVFVKRLIQEIVKRFKS